MDDEDIVLPEKRAFGGERRAEGREIFFPAFFEGLTPPSLL